MSESDPLHPFPYRQEMSALLFRAVRAHESCAVIGVSSMGKSRLVQFLQRKDVQQHYVQDADSFVWVVADGNRLAEISEWGLYELLLTSLAEAAGRHAVARTLRAELTLLQREAIVARDALLARRHMEAAAQMVCQDLGLHLCILLDECDEWYKQVPPQALANLRALRDMNKYRLSYILMLRDLPARLRPTVEGEGFYELISRSLFGLVPYTRRDAEDVLRQIEQRKDQRLSEHDRDLVLSLSGGHPGMILALYDVLSRYGSQLLDLQSASRSAWLLKQPIVYEEWQKLWDGLAEDERIALSHIVQDIEAAADIRRVLLLKGLLQQRVAGGELFSPLFHQFVQTQAIPTTQTFWVDEAARVVWVGQKAIKTLTAREFDLLSLLYQHIGHVCSRDQILEYLYPQEHQDGAIEDNRVDALIKRIREKVEPARQRPRYILTVRGKGYRLVQAPSAEGEQRP